MKNQIRKMLEQTFIIIKPDGVEKHLENKIFKRFQNEGLKVRITNKIVLPKEFIYKFYSHLNNLPKANFEDIVSYMTSNYAILAILEGENAIEKAVRLCGPTNPAKAPKGTIRGDFSNDDMEECIKQLKAVHNIIHRSSSKEDAKNEIGLVRDYRLFSS